jgi:hypothetical protein
MADDRLRQLFRDAFSKERPASTSFHGALSRLEERPPTIWSPAVKVALAAMALMLLAGLPVMVWVARHNGPNPVGVAPASASRVASPSHLPTQSPSQPMANSPEVIPTTSSGPPAAIAPVIGVSYHDRSGHIESLVSWDFPDADQHKLVFSWSAGVASTWSYSVEMGQFQFLGNGSDGHSMAVLVSKQGWVRINLTPVGQPSPTQLNLVAWETSPNSPWRLADNYNDGLFVVGFMTIDGPRAAKIGQMVIYRLQWKINEARVTWSGYGGANLEFVSYRFATGTGGLDANSDHTKWFSFSSATGTLELTFRVAGQPGLAFVSAYIGGTRVCCGPNTVQVTVSP